MTKDKVVLICEDEREIKGIWEVGVEEIPAVWTVGKSDVTKIIAYEDKGLNGYMPWLAVYKGEEIAARVPAHGFGVQYKESKT